MAKHFRKLLRYFECNEKESGPCCIVMSELLSQCLELHSFKTSLTAGIHERPPLLLVILTITYHK